MAEPRIVLGSQHGGTPRAYKLEVATRDIEPEGATRQIFTRIRDAVRTAQLDESEFGQFPYAANSVAAAVRSIVHTIVSEGLETQEQRALVDVGFKGANGLSQVLLRERIEPDRAETAKLLGKDEVSVLTIENKIFDIIGIALHDKAVIILPPIEILRQSIEANIKDKSDLGTSIRMLRGSVRAAVHIAVAEHLNEDESKVVSERFGGWEGLYLFLLDNTAPKRGRPETAQNLGMDVKSVLEHENSIVKAVIHELHYADVLDHHPYDYLLMGAERRS